MPPFSLKPQPPTHKRINCIIQSIFKLCSQGNLTKALQSLDSLTHKGLRLDTKTLSFRIQQCATAKSLRKAKWIHLHMKVTSVNPPNTLLLNRLICMYCECGSHADARKVFDRMVNRNLYSWNNMLYGYCKLGMVKPARKLFDKMVEKDVVSWNTMVIGYAQSGVFYAALRIYKEFRRLGIGYSEFSFAGALTVCVKLKELGLTRQGHCQVYVAGFLNNVVLGSSVADAYAKCGEVSCGTRDLIMIAFMHTCRYMHYSISVIVLVAILLLLHAILSVRLKWAS